MKIRLLFKKRTKQDTLGSVYLALYFLDYQELIPTGLKVTEKEYQSWKKQDDQLPKNHLSKEAKTIVELKAKVNQAITRLQAKESVITPYAVKMEFENHKSGKVNDQLIKDKRNKENQKLVKTLAKNWMEQNLFQYKPSTQKAVKESIEQFLEYLDKAGKAGVERQDLVPELITAYEKYLQERRKLANSTHGKRMKHLRWFLKAQGYDVSNIKIRSHKKTIVSLTNEEITALENHDVSKSSEQQKAKDLYLLGCYTGLRISDLKRINASCIQDGKICMTLQKNKKAVTIPIVEKTQSILHRYGMKSPKLSEPVLNRTIKDVCKDAGIVQSVTVRTNIAGKDVDKVYPKHKLITSHTAGKTFISLATEWYGLTPAEIAAIVGKDLKTIINHYFNLPLDSAIKKMLAVKTD